MGSPGPSPRPAVVSELLSVSEGALPPPLVVEGAGGDTNNPSKKCIDSPPPPTSHPTITSVLAGAPSSVVGGTEGLPVEDLSSEENVTDVVFCPLNRVGALIGKKGVVIRDLCTRSRCSIRVLKNDDKLGQETTGAAVTVSGRAGDVIEGKTLVEQVRLLVSRKQCKLQLNHCDLKIQFAPLQVIRDGYNSLPRQLPVPGSIRGTMKVSRDKVGRVIGRGGWVVRSLEHHCRVKVEIDDVALEAGASASAEKVIALTGTSEGVEAAKQAIQQVRFTFVHSLVV
jgi:rRNA processing protein Krr1/Pno1